jgi:SAM-dependent methyltransferase
MPVNAYQTAEPPMLQRQQYAKGGIGQWYWDRRDQEALSFIDKNDHIILDLGCGEGITLERLKKLFPQKKILGIDVDPENIKICADHNLPVQFGDLYALDIPENSIDVVFFLEVLEHLHHPALALKEIKRILRPGGKLVLIFPHDLIFLLARLMTLKIKEARYDPGHLYQWTPKKVKALLTELGFTIVAQKNLPFYFWTISLHGLVVATKNQ